MTNLVLEQRQPEQRSPVSIVDAGLADNDRVTSQVVVSVEVFVSFSRNPPGKLAGSHPQRTGKP